MNEYKVKYVRDESGWWVASVKGVPGCHTQGRTIDQARRRIREALALFIDEMRDVKLVDDVRLPTDINRMLNQISRSRKRVADEAASLKESTKQAADALTSRLGISVRDAGELLDLSHQRIHQLLLENSNDKKSRVAHKVRKRVN